MRALLRGNVLDGLARLRLLALQLPRAHPTVLAACQHHMWGVVGRALADEERVDGILTVSCDLSGARPRVVAWPRLSLGAAQVDLEPPCRAAEHGHIMREEDARDKGLLDPSQDAVLLEPVRGDSPEVEMFGPTRDEPVEVERIVNKAEHSFGTTRSGAAESNLRRRVQSDRWRVPNELVHGNAVVVVQPHGHQPQGHLVALELGPREREVGDATLV
mmetsp:Transcript_12407/g.33742  ORF Transcript_12407/g.33742 Transcript_12407/m.33742 type:complete len:217 (-) Transcript_12407:1547-2197(-)